MKRVLNVLTGAAAVIAALFVIGPYEPVVLEAPFDAAAIGDNPDTYLGSREAVFDDIADGAAKRIVWAGAPNERTPLAVLYIHGFSASAEEIRPVPDMVAEALGANLYFTRLAGHGRSAEAMAGPTANDWMIDMAEAMAIGRAIGDEVIVISTSTGGTIAALGALDSQMSDALKGITFVSPNFAINNPLAPLLTFPAARHWLPLIAGETRGFTPLNEEQAAHWTESYPSLAVFPMAAIVKAARGADYSAVNTPALFIYSQADQVVDANATNDIVARWGGPTTVMDVPAGDGIEASAHVIAGDIVSPKGTAPAVAKILDWARGL